MFLKFYFIRNLLSKIIRQVWMEIKQKITFKVA